MSQSHKKESKRFGRNANGVRVHVALWSDWYMDKLHAMHLGEKKYNLLGRK